MKKKFELNLDALIVLVLLFSISLGMNFVLYRLYSDSADQNVKMQFQALEDKMNLDSMQAYIDRLKDTE